MSAQLAIQVGAQLFSQTAGVPNPGRLLESSRELLKTTNDWAWLPGQSSQSLCRRAWV